MRMSHIYLFAVALATLGVVAAAPVAAQEEGAIDSLVSTAPELTAEQQAEFDSWPSEQQAQYELWSAETKAYYWELPPSRQMLFWQLTDDDKIALTAMTGPERDAAWEQIERSAVAAPT